MSIVSPTSGTGRSGDPAHDVAIRQVDGPDRERAAAKLVHESARGSPGAGRAFLDMAARYNIDVANLWASLKDNHVRQVCLATPGAGRTLNCFVSTPTSPTEEQELGEVIRAATRAGSEPRASTPSPALAQALLDPSERPAERAYLHAGFRPIASLSYMQGRIPSPKRDRPATPPPLPPHVTLQHWTPALEHDFIAALDRSYIDTLDCPELCEIRQTRDVLASHLATGEHDPSLWWLIRVEGRPEGALLLNPCPAQSQIELVYLGLGPDLRGKKLSAPLLRYAIAIAATKRPERLVVCAVDHRNAPALRVYQSLGFREFAARNALVLPLAPGAR
ncbi:MAG: GNAT family N-acetyltransferase [Phycisphaerales bacterium]